MYFRFVAVTTGPQSDICKLGALPITFSLDEDAFETLLKRVTALIELGLHNSLGLSTAAPVPIVPRYCILRRRVPSTLLYLVHN